MAEITTHIFFSKEVMNKFNCSKSIKYFSLGPDVFYFSNKTKYIGYIMHRKKTLLFFENYIKYIKNNNLENNKYVVGSLYGFLTHYILDSTIHPYIFYKGGLHNGMHRVYEMGLSKYIISNNGVNPNEYKITSDLDIQYNDDVIKLLDHVLKETYNIDNGGKLYYKCINKVKRIYMLFRYDKYGIKKGIYRFIDIFYKKRISSASFYNIEDVDLNLNHKKWYHPCTKEKYNTSLIDLYNNSLESVYKIINAVNLVLESKRNIDSLDKIIGNNSLINGLNCDEKRPLKYFEN